mgnify:CR=1 FL=1
MMRGFYNSIKWIQKVTGSKIVVRSTLRGEVLTYLS